MVMKEGMYFKGDEYKKLTTDQQSKLRELKKAKAARLANTGETSPPGTPATQGTQPQSGTRSHNIANVLTNTMSITPSAPPKEKILYQGVEYKIASTNITYIVGNHKTAKMGSLLDGGANGGLGGSDMRMLHETHDRVDVTGIGNKQITDVPVGTGASLIFTTTGPIIGIFNQYACTGTGNTIHSCGQMRSYGVSIDEVPIRLKGTQSIRHPDGYVIPLHVRNGLTYMDMSLPSDTDLLQYSHVVFTSDVHWDPSTLDQELRMDEVHTFEADLIPDYGEEYATTVPYSDEEEFEELLEGTYRDTRSSTKRYKKKRTDTVLKSVVQPIVLGPNNIPSSLPPSVASFPENNSIDQSDGDSISCPALWDQRSDSSSSSDGEYFAGYTCRKKLPVNQAIPSRVPQEIHLDDFGEYVIEDNPLTEKVEHALQDDFTAYVDNCLREVHFNKVDKSRQNWDDLSPNFGFIPQNRMEKTVENTTQFGRVDHRWPMRHHFKSRSPAYNVRRLNDIFGSDAIISSTPAHDDGIKGHGGCKILQLFSGWRTKYKRGYPLSKHSEFPECLKTLIRKVGAPNGLFMDNAYNETSKPVDSILNVYAIDDMQSEPHYQNQNPTERDIQEVKKMTNGLMDRTGTPPKYWLLCVLYVTNW